MLTAPDSDRLRLVLVDDAVDLRELMGFALERCGAFTVVGEAADGEEGLRVIEDLRPDVVLLDVAMPVMDGLEMLSLARPLCPASAFIVYSAHPSSRLAQLALDLGADAYLQKGASPRTMIAQVLAATRKRDVSRAS
jgi:DNA-binding NarL/FixJ family response regulator